jgi:hypothetical protein
MGQLSIVFHIASLFGLIGLILWVLRLQLIVKTWRYWSLPVTMRGVFVAEPVRALRVFACAVGAEFEAEVAVNALPPQKITLSRLFDLHRLGGITRITVTTGEPPVVSFHLQAETGTMESDFNRIAQELGGAMRVVVAQEHQ